MVAPRTHTKVNGATWPSVASRSQRLEWIAAILAEENIDCAIGNDYPYSMAVIALALLRAVADDQSSIRELRLACFEALLDVENGIETAEARS